MNSASTTATGTKPTASSSFFSFSSLLNFSIFLFLLLLLIVGLVLMASGYEVIQTFSKTLQKIFEQHPLNSAKSSGSPLFSTSSKQDLEKEREDSESDSESDSDSEMEKLETMNEPILEEENQPNLEMEMELENKDTNRSLDNAIETSINKSNEPTTVETFVPIDEEDISKDTTGWCFIGESKGSRGCAPMGKQDKCITGEVYVNQMECLKIHPEDAPKPPGPHDAYYRNK